MSWIKGEILNFIHILIVWFKLSCVGLQKQNDQVQTHSSPLDLFQEGCENTDKSNPCEKEAAKVAFSYF